MSDNERNEGCAGSGCEGCPSASQCGSAGEPGSGEECAGFSQAALPHNIKNVIAIASGKGGVGKSSVTAMLAAELNRKGLKVGVMDADITGPSIPKVFGLSGNVHGDGEHILPSETKEGLKVISINLMLDDEEAPVVWRGPIISNLIQQFWTEVNWGELDVLLIDMPPGTGDVPITVFQSIPVDGIIMVTMPQELVGLIVRKAVGMVKMINIPIIGMIENMSYFECPDCGKRMEVFGTSKVDETAAEYGLPVLAKLPVNPEVSQKSDAGDVEHLESKELGELASYLMDNVLKD